MEKFDEHFPIWMSTNPSKDFVFENPPRTLVCIRSLENEFSLPSFNKVRQNIQIFHSAILNFRSLIGRLNDTRTNEKLTSIEYDVLGYLFSSEDDSSSVKSICTIWFEAFFTKNITASPW